MQRIRAFGQGSRAKQRPADYNTIEELRTTNDPDDPDGPNAPDDPSDQNDPDDPDARSRCRE
jgi:hypothetical protein